MRGDSELTSATREIASEGHPTYHDWEPLAVKRVAQLLVTSVVLAVVLARTPLDEIRATLGGLHAGFLAVALLLQMGVRVLAAARTAVLTRHQDLDLSTWQVLLIGLASQFYSLSPLGGVAGAAVRLQRFSQGGSAYARSVAVVVGDRTVDLAGLVAVGSLLWFLDPKRPVGDGLSLTLLLVVVAAIVLGITLGSRRLGVRPPGEPEETPLLETRGARGWLDRGRDAFGRCLTALMEFRLLSVRDRWSLVGLTLAKDALGVLTFMALAASLGLALTAPTLGWIRSLAAILAVLPIAFRGLGVREAGLVLLLAPYGVSAAQAVSLSAVIFAITLIFGLLGAAGELVGARSRSSAGSPALRASGAPVSGVRSSQRTNP